MQLLLIDNALAKLFDIGILVSSVHGQCLTHLRSVVDYHKIRNCKGLVLKMAKRVQDRPSQGAETSPSKTIFAFLNFDYGYSVRWL